MCGGTRKRRAMSVIWTLRNSRNWACLFVILGPKNVLHTGILWQDGRNRRKPAVLIEWRPELRATIDEAIAISSATA